MSSGKKEKARGGKRSATKGEVEITDEELRELVAPVAAIPLLTKDEEDAALARLQPAIKRRVRLDELKH